jgi:two-component system, NarL family, sensor kinase
MNNPQDLLARVDALSQMQSSLATRLNQNQEQMRGLAKRVWRIQEEERKQIARELHDGLGQLLTALINQLQHCSRHSDMELAPSLELARTALHETREISRLMRPRILDDLGLQAALQWLVRIMGEKSTSQIQLSDEIARPLDEETQTLVFRVVQEALTNAVKHANASLIQVRVVAKEQLLLISVSDNGKGMDTAASEPGFGLTAMQDRVMAFGGQLTIDTSTAAGCALTVLLTRIDAV